MPPLAGGVYTPEALIDPPASPSATDQLTAALGSDVTEAWNASVWPAATLAVRGATATEPTGPEVVPLGLEAVPLGLEAVPLGLEAVPLVEAEAPPPVPWGLEQATK